MSITLPQRIRGSLAIAFALATIVFIAQPAQADFTPPNTPKLTKSVEVTAATGASKAFYDDANNVVHVLGTDTLTTYDADTLAVKASTVLDIDGGETFWQYGNAFDPEHAMIFATKQSSGGSQLQAWQYLPADGAYTLFDINIPAYRTVVYSTELDRVYSIETADAGYVTPTVGAATRDEFTTAWVPGPAYENIAIGGDNTAVQSVVATSAGKLVGTYLTTGSGSGPSDIQITRKSLFSFSDTGNDLVPTEIPGTEFSPATIPYPTSLPVGWRDLTPKADGSVTATEFAEAATRRMITLNPSADPSGFTVDAATLSVPFQPSFTAFDADGDLYFSSSDTLSLYLSGALSASSDAGQPMRGLAAGDGQAYVFSGTSSPYSLAAVSIGGYSPTITADPASQSISVDTTTESKSVTFQSGATATPTPTVRWQKLPSGSSTWSDIPGATSADLTFGATSANNGESYRAVYTNIAGEIATSTALLTVSLPTTTTPPPELPIGVPAPAEPQVKNGKAVKLKHKKGKSARVKVGTVTCASASTCIYTLPTSIKFKIGKKTFKAKVTALTGVAPGQSAAVYVVVPEKAVKALKGKKTKLIVSVKVSNSAGVTHNMAKSIISKISA